MRKHLILYLLLWFVLFSGFTAHAADTDDAKRAFEEGTALYNNDQFAEAAEAFRKAYRLRPSWKILFNIGQCSAAAKEYGLALEAFESYLSQGGDDVPAEKRRNVIGEIKILREMVGYLTITAPEGCEVLIDEHLRGTTPLPGAIPVGSGVNHKLEIVRAGLSVLKKTVRVNSGNTINVSVDKTQRRESSPAGAAAGDSPSGSRAGDGESDTAASDETPSTGKKPLLIAGAATAGVGVALLGASLGTGLKTKSLSNSLNKRAPCVGDECDKDTKKMKDLQKTTNILLGVGGTLAVAGAAMLIVALVAGNSDADDTLEKDAAPVAVTPVIMPNNIGFSVSYQF